MDKKSIVKKSFICLMFVCLTASAALAQTAAFNYQGRLTDMGNPANGNYQLEFKLFDAVAGGAQIGGAVSDVAVTAAQGVFNTQLDFGANVFTGADRFLEIAVRRNAGEAYVTLNPRQQIASSPYSIRTLSAAQADLALDSQKLGGIDASEYVSTSTVGNAFIKNDTTQQTGANMNISGNGVFGGNVGIGTIAPIARLTVSGTGPYNAAGAARFDLFNPAAGDGSLQHVLDSGAWQLGTTSGLTRMLITSAGNIGIGTVNPQARLHAVNSSSTAVTGENTSGGFGVVGFSATGTAVYGETSGFGVQGRSTGGAGSIGVLGENFGSGTGVVGTGISGRGVEGRSNSFHGVYGFSQTQVGVAGESNNFDGVYGTSHSALNAGVSAHNDAGGFGLFGETNAASSGSIAGVYGRATGSGGIGVTGEANTGNAWGVFGTSTSPTGFGVYGKNLAGGFAMGAEGNVTQNRDKGGWVKAMLLVNDNGTIARCYNSFLTGSAASTVPCGFSVTLPFVGQPVIDLGFGVADRFVSVTVMNFNAIFVNFGAQVEFPSTNRIKVRTFYADTRIDETTNVPFFIIIF